MARVRDGHDVVNLAVGRLRNRRSWTLGNRAESVIPLWVECGHP